MMMMLTSTLQVIIFVLFISSSSSVSARGVNWFASEPTSDDALLDMMILIKQQNVHILRERLMNVSDPSHEHYGQFWTIEHTNDVIKPHAHHHRSVTDWLTAHGVFGSAVVYSDAIRFKVRADTATRMFNVSFRQYRRADTAAVIHRVAEPNNVSVPPHIADAVDAFLGLYDFPTQRGRRSAHEHVAASGLGNSTANTTARAFLPYTAVNMYGLPATSSSATTSQGVMAFEITLSGVGTVYSFSESDLYLFANALNLGERTVANVIGNNDQSHISPESNLDVQMITGVNGGASTSFYVYDNSDWIYSAFLELVNTDSSTSIPDVISISYSAVEEYYPATENSQYNFYSYQNYIQRTDVELIKLNLRGTTILASSGDDGANFNNEECCYNGEYSQYGTPGFEASYPATSPYVLAVGATDIPLAVQQANFSFRYPIEDCEYYTCVSGPAGSEVAVSIAETTFTSGGGFSRVEPTPYWQYNFVQTYLGRASELPPASYWNSSRRGYPDVSALGGPTFIIYNNAIRLEAGTSASTPLFAALIARLNDVQVRLRGHTLGFINPLFYQMATNTRYHTFNDITTGDNICPYDNSNCYGLCGDACAGFVTTEGWDPVTGLGTPNYTEMVRYITEYSYTTNLTYNGVMDRYGHTSNIRDMTVRLLLCIVIIAVSCLLLL